MKIIAEIPARMGSVRVKHKNLRDLNGKPMIAYAIEAAVGSELVSEVYVNSESDIIGAVAQDYGAQYYKRRAELATDTATQDEFNYDFIKGTQADVLVLVNPVAPLVVAEDVDKVVRFFLDNDFDTVIPVREEQVHAFYKDQPINFAPDGFLPKTQDLVPVQMCVWTVCVWRAETFLREFEESGHASFVGKVGLFPVDPLRSVKVSYEADFLLAEALLAQREKLNG